MLFGNDVTDATVHNLNTGYADTDIDWWYQKYVIAL